MSLALLYVRVSSVEQEREGYSLDAQEKLGHEYAKRKGLTIAKSWKVSESAWKQERSAFNQLVDYAKRHDEIGHIIFDVTDRMTRNDFDKLKIYTLIKEHGKTVHFSRTNKNFNRDSGSDDEFMFDIEVAVAKKMSNDISRKSQMGMLEKAEQGLYPSVAPLGYRNNLVTHLLDVDEATAPYIQRAFTLMATGRYSLSTLGDLLHQEGLRNKGGNRVGKSALAYVLSRPIYYGAFVWKGKLYQGSHTPLISKELFDKVQDVLHGRHHANVRGKNFPFNNLIVCGLCECKVLGETKKRKYHYYHCTFSKGRHNGIGYVREDRLAVLFEEPVKAVTLPEDLAELAKEALREATGSALELQGNRLKSLEVQQERVNTRLSRLYDAKFDGEIAEEAFRLKEAEYKTYMIEIKAQTDSVKRINPRFYDDGCQTLELSKRLYRMYVKANYVEKANLLRLIASNYALNDVTLTPTYRSPFSIFAKGASRPNWLPGVSAQSALLWDEVPIRIATGRWNHKRIIIEELA